MTIEETLERLRLLCESGRVSADQILGRIPELRESEDERIRSAMIRGFNSLMANQPVDTFAGVSIRDILAYLEKQKEQKPTFIVPERIRPKFAVGDTVCRPMWSDHTILEIYIGCNDPVYVCVNEEGTESHISFSEQSEWEKKEQKPAEWSEEDEKMFESFMHKLEVCNLLTNKEITWAKLRLKSLRPQLSNEDIKKIRSEEYTKGFNDAAFGGKAWKPSEEEKSKK